MKTLSSNTFNLPQLASCWLTLAASALVLPGCGGGGGSVEDYSDLEAVVLREKLIEVDLGHFDIPVPIEVVDENGQRTVANMIQLKFSLHALVVPDEAKKVARIGERDEGQLRDRVISACRNASVGELMDPQKSTLRARLRDSTQPLFEGDTIRRMVLNDFISEPL